MNKKIRAIGAGLLAGLWLCLCVVAWFKAPDAQSDSERRKLTQMPQLTVSSLLNGTFMDKFADYGVDQFPLRDTFRSVKALFSQKVLLQQDNNGYFIKDGYIVKQTYPLNGTSLHHAITVFDGLYQTYLENSDCKIYFAVVPDKGYYLSGYPTMDYSHLFDRLEEKITWAEHIDITQTLDIFNYYRTDTHWRQETLRETANALCQAMGVEGPGNMETVTATEDFYGVYYGHAAIPMDPEQLQILTNDLLSACKVYDASGKELAMYDESKLTGADPYEVYLSGNQPLVRIENPNATGDRELVIFRDSFGSSITPLLLSSYKTVTLVDVRYMNPELLSQFVTFDAQDVLFLYSTLILNESATLRK